VVSVVVSGDATTAVAEAPTPKAKAKRKQG